MRGSAGDFVNVTWPGYVGTLTASAPGRFAAAINQAPLWRRTRRPWLRPYDLAVNAFRTWPHSVLPTRPSAARGVRDLPRFRRGQASARDRTDRASGDLHAHRLRARRALRDRAHRTSVCHARPRDIGGQRLAAHHDAVGGAGLRQPVADHFTGRGGGQQPTRGARRLRPGRKPFGHADFAWVTPPVLNPFTRIAVEMCAASGTVRVVGYEVDEASALPQPVTHVCELAASPAGVPA